MQVQGQVKLLRLKIVLLGDGGVGKSSLIARYVHQAFREDYLKTLGAAISKRTEEFHTRGEVLLRAEMTIWDIMGQKRLFDLVQEAYLTGAVGGLAVFDVTRRETFDGLRGWVATAKKENPRMPLVVLGNKSDLEGQRAVTDEMARAFCQEFGLSYYPTSAKSGLNVEVAFRQIARKALGQRVTVEEEQ